MRGLDFSNKKNKINRSKCLNTCMFHIVKQLEYHLMQQLKMPNSKRVTKYSLLDSNDSNN